MTSRDISLCTGTRPGFDCPISDQCLRYQMAPRKGWHNQTWIEAPYNQAKNECELFMEVPKDAA